MHKKTEDLEDGDVIVLFGSEAVILDVMYNFDNMEILVKVDGFERVSKLYVWEGELVEVIGK